MDGEEETLAIWLPEAMRDIVNKVSFGVASVSNDDENPYTQKSKKEYKEQLPRCFASQEFIII